jgi:TPR repeat protein
MVSRTRKITSYAVLIALLAFIASMFMTGQAQNNIAYFYHTTGNDEEAFKWLNRAAERGRISAQIALSGLYYAGRNGVEKDDKQAVFWWRRAAEQGDATAQNALGAAYGTGTGVTQDYKEAFKWWRMAAEQGDARGEYFVGVAYYAGLGVERNEEEGIKWLEKAATENSSARKLLRRIKEVRSREALQEILILILKGMLSFEVGP